MKTFYNYFWGLGYKTFSLLLKNGANKLLRLSLEGLSSLV
jgi:hypothetical protein